MVPEHDIQKKYLELQTIHEHLKQIQEHHGMIQQQLLELSKLSSALDTLTNAQPGSSSYVPLGGGIFVPAELTDLQHLLVTVGSNVVVVKSLSEAKALVQLQTKDLAETLQKIEDDLQKIGAYGAGVQEELQAMLNDHERK